MLLLFSRRYIDRYTVLSKDIRKFLEVPYGFFNTLSNRQKKITPKIKGIDLLPHKSLYSLCGQNHILFQDFGPSFLVTSKVIFLKRTLLRHWLLCVQSKYKKSMKLRVTKQSSKHLNYREHTLLVFISNIVVVKKWVHQCWKNLTCFPFISFHVTPNICFHAPSNSWHMNAEGQFKKKHYSWRKKGWN
jgi:hypothetical protein